MQYGETQEIQFNGETYQGFKVSLANVNKTAIIRLPTDQDIQAYLTAYNKVRAKKTTSESDKRQPDLALLTAIKIAGDDFDEYEAEVIVDKLISSHVTKCELDAGVYTVTLTTPFNETVHILNPPSFKALSIFRSKLADAKSAHGIWCDLYDQLVKSTEGYAGEVPAYHKPAVSTAVFGSVNSIDPFQTTDPNA